jgi:octaprenyl-diphosphate synthase
MMIPVRFMVQIVLDNNAKIANIVQIYSYFCAVKNLNDIIHPIAADLLRFEAYFEQTLRAETAPMDAIMGYVKETQGKRLRPILVLLSARLFGEINEKTLCAATFVEMVHSATLIHDDVVDDSEQRRGQASVKTRFDSRAAVLAGDYLLAKAMLLPNDNAILQEMLHTAAAMSEGELMQNQQNADYLEIITRKTALLMRSCCAMGAMSVGASQEQVQQITDFGLYFGILFQLRDDILDADSPENKRLAEALCPEYLDKTLKALSRLPQSSTTEILEQLTHFCANRMS